MEGCLATALQSSFPKTYPSKGARGGGEAAKRPLATALRAVSPHPTLDHPQAEPSHRRRPERVRSVLTDRERGVVQLIAEGNTNKQVANQLGISLKTVETHKTQLMERLGIRDVAGLVRYAIRVGLVSAEH